MKKSKLLFYSVINSLGVLAYVLLVVLLITNGQKFFGQANNFLGSAAMLLLLVLSATITGLLVLGRPGYLYFNGLKKEGLSLLFYTIICLFVITIIIFFILILLK